MKELHSPRMTSALLSGVRKTSNTSRSKRLEAAKISLAQEVKTLINRVLLVNGICGERRQGQKGSHAQLVLHKS